MGMAPKSQESPYSAFVRELGLNTDETIDWSGKGCHVEFKKREDIPLALHEVLGSGGYAVVQKVIHTAGNNTPLAQKIIRNYKDGLESIMAEVKHIQKLRHRHLIQLVGTYALKRDLHILLFPVGQWNLRHFLEDLQDFDMSRKVYSEFCSLGMFFKCLACALGHLHNETTPHIKHLDIKPENIIVRRYAPHRLTILLTDFGVSRSFQPNTTSQDVNTLYTSPIYAAPEISQCKSFGRPADMFSLGCVFAEMASVLGGKKLLEFSDYRLCQREDGSSTVAFGSNLKACTAWLEMLRPNAPFRQLSIWDSDWWIRLIELITEMISVTPLNRPDSTRLVACFPPGPCCDVPLEEYSKASGLKPVAQLEVDNWTHLGDSKSMVTDSRSSPVEDELFSDTLVPNIQVSIPHGMSQSTDIDWSGKGGHVDSDEHEPPLLEQLDVIGLGNSSLVTKVRTINRGPYILAKKSLQIGRHLLRLEMLLQEIKMLQKLRHGHIVRLIGTLKERRFFSLLTYPAADWNLQTFLESMTPRTDLPSVDPSLGKRRLALQKFFKCLIHGLHYLHSQGVKHKDIKPSNILVQRLPAGDDYHVYLADFGLSTVFNPGYESQTAGLTGYTPKYASPEVLADATRGRASDIFSMGCVWLEMYTVLLGERLEDFEHRHLLSEDALDEVDARDIDDDSHGFASNLPRTRQWIETLLLYCSMHGSLVLCETETISGLDISCFDIRQGLNIVKQMLQEDPRKRPGSAELSRKLGSNMCCDQDVPIHELGDDLTNVEVKNWSKPDMSLIKNDTEKPKKATPQVEMLSILPYRRDDAFIGREEILQEISLKFSGANPLWVALVGLGGIGKTQIAIEYAYLLWDKQPKTNVFWVNASSSIRFEQSFDSIAYAIGLPGLYDSDINAQERVVRWLEEDCSGHWLLILDNCDDTSAFHTTADQNDLEQQNSAYPINLPRNPRGKILITSRNINLALQLTGTKESIVHVGCMTKEESALLLKNNLPYDPSGEHDRRTLVQALGYLPLAISQATAFIASRAPRMTISKYVDLFERNEKNQVTLLNHDGGDLRRDPSLINAVATTWYISFDQIRAQHQVAADLLSRLSVLGQDIIPIFLLSEDERVGPELEEGIRVLNAYSFVTIQGDQANLQVHRLVQLVTRAWLKAHAEITRRKEEALGMLVKKFPSVGFANWKICEVLEPHVRVVLTYKPLSSNVELQRAALLHNCGHYALVRGNLDLATSRIREAIDIRNQLLGCEHPDSLASLYVLALIMKSQGQWIQAEELEIKVTEASSRVLGQEHPNTLSSIASLALTYSNQGRWEDAEELDIQVMEARAKVLGQEHPDTLTSVSQLGSVLSRQGKYKEAETMHRRALEAREKVLGAKHPDMLISVSLLGTVLESQGKYEEAEAMHRRALEAREKVLGREHPHTLTSINNLGLVLSRQGKYEEAEIVQRQALEGSLKVLGREHPHTYTSVNNLGLVLLRQGKYEEAEVVQRQALEGSMKVLGSEHPHTLASISNLGSVLSSQGKYKEAEAMHRQALAARERVLGSQHPDTLSSVSNLGSALSSQGKYKEAEAMHRQALAARERVLGSEHPDTLASINNLGSVLSSQGKYKEAEAMHRQALATRERMLGPEHPDTLASMNNLAFTLMGQRYDSRAILLIEECFRLRERVLGPRHPFTISSFSTLNKWRLEKMNISD